MLGARRPVFFLVFGFGIACGGASSSTLQTGEGGAGGGRDGGAKSGDAGDASNGTDTATPPMDSSSGGDTGGGPGVDAKGPPDTGSCPDISGRYGQIMAFGGGCGDFNDMAPECITAGGACTDVLTSPNIDGGPAVNGSLTLDAMGTFGGASLVLGTTPRMGCVGRWDPMKQELTIDCGGMGSSQSCIVVMKRTGVACK